jgi:hypothetical protein
VNILTIVLLVLGSIGLVCIALTEREARRTAEEPDCTPEAPTLPDALVKDKPLSDRLMGPGWKAEPAWVQEETENG